MEVFGVVLDVADQLSELFRAVGHLLVGPALLEVVLSVEADGEGFGGVDVKVDEVAGDVEAGEEDAQEEVGRYPLTDEVVAGDPVDD